VSKLSLDTRIMEVDRLVRGLPNWAQQCVFRRYMYDQEDRPAAKELKMRVGEYTQRRRAAVELIADKLDERYIRHACR
jgi:hypothetical protein